MNTLILNAETANLSIEHLLKQLDKGGLTVRDMHGNMVAVVLSAADQEALTYAEAKQDLDQHRDEVQRALLRRGGITTVELLAKANAVAGKVAKP